MWNNLSLNFDYIEINSSTTNVNAADSNVFTTISDTRYQDEFISRNNNNNNSDTRNAPKLEIAAGKKAKAT